MSAQQRKCTLSVVQSKRRILSLFHPSRANWLRTGFVDMTLLILTRYRSFPLQSHGFARTKAPMRAIETLAPVPSLCTVRRRAPSRAGSLATRE